MELTKERNFISIIKFALIVLIGSLLLILSAKIQTPFIPVPATMQTFAVLLLGICFGYKVACWSVVIYLIEGALGLPVFAAGGGLIYLQGPTSGYLFGLVNSDAVTEHRLEVSVYPARLAASVLVMGFPSTLSVIVHFSISVFVRISVPPINFNSIKIWKFYNMV